MKICYNCGAQIIDGCMFCQMCGTKVEDSATFQSEMGASQPTIYQNEAGYQQPQMYQSGVGYQQPQMYQNGVGYQGTQMYQNGDGYKQPQNKKNKIGNKKPLIIAIAAICVLVAVAAGAFFLLKPKKGLSDKEAKKLVNNYIDTIEDKDIFGLIEATMPEKLVNNIIDEAISIIRDEYDDIDEFQDDYEDFKKYDEYDELIDLLKDTIKYEGIDDLLDDADISFSDVEIGDVERFSFENYFERLDVMIEETCGEGYSVEGILEQMDYSVEELEELAEEYLDKVDMSLDDIYIIDFSFSLSVDVRSYGEFEIEGEDYCIDHMFAYQYDDEWYLIPGVEGAFVPSMIRYIEKARVSNDISAAKTINTAINTALGNERIYELLAINGAVITIYPDKETDAIEITYPSGSQWDDGFDRKDAEEKLYTELMNSFSGRTPKISCKENVGDSSSDAKPEVYYVYVSDYGSVYVFIGAAGNEEYVRTTEILDDEERCIYSICPEVCDTYW